MIDGVLADAGISMQQLAGIVVCAGPGSYTGLRIGMATAKGFCYALNIPLFLDNKLTLLAYQAFMKHGKEYDKYVAALLARDKEYFISCFDNNFQNIAPATHIMDAELGNYLTGGQNTCIVSESISMEEAEKYTEKINVESIVNIDLNQWAFYAFEQFKCNNSVNLSTAEPFYLKQVYTHNNY